MFVALLLPLLANAAAPIAPMLRVAVLHDTGPLSTEADHCKPTDRLCRVNTWTRQAAEQGARLLVTPEYILQLRTPARSLAPGDRPPPDHVLAPLAEATREHGIYVAIALWMRDETGKSRNAQVVVGPDGRIEAVHHKVELFAAEREWVTPGTDMTVATVDGHTVGMLICADLYGDPTNHTRLVESLQAELVVISAEWTAEGAPRWGAAFAHDWQVPVAFANTGQGAAVGSGIFDARGAPLAESRSHTAELLVVDVPLRSATSP